MLGNGQQHWATVHVADLANFFRRVLENDSARGTYVIGNGEKSTVAQITEAAAVAAGGSGAAPGSDEEARARLGDYFAEVLLLDQGTKAGRARCRARVGADPPRARRRVPHRQLPQVALDPPFPRFCESEPEMTSVAQHWIDGAWVGSGAVTESINPATGEVLGQWHEGGEVEAKEAVSAAAARYLASPWSRIRPCGIGR